MAVMAPVSDLSVALLTRLTAALPLPESAAAPGKQSSLPGVTALLPPDLAAGPGQQLRVPDVVVFSSAPMRVLSDLASAGLRQLTALLPVLDQAVQTQNAAPIAILAKAVASAARQISEGHTALVAEGPDRVAAALRGEVLPRTGSPTVAVTDTKQLLRTLARQIGAEAEAEPAQDSRTSETLRTIARQIGASDQFELRSAGEPAEGPIQRWLAEAKHVLRGTSDALDRAEEQLRPIPTAEPINIVGATPTAWVLTEILAAQAQIARAYAAVGQARTTARASVRAAPRHFSLDHLSGATTLFGMSLILSTLWIIGGLWAVATGLVALAGTAIWVWRISRATRGVTLDAPS